MSKAMGWRRVFREPRVWMWSAIACGVFACGLLEWLYLIQRRDVDRSLDLVESVRTARIDLAKGSLRIRTAAAGDQQAVQYAEALVLVQQAIDQMASVLQQANLAPEQNVSYPLTREELIRRADRYLALLRDYTKGRVDEVALRIAYGELERFSESVDNVNRSQLSGIRNRARIEFSVALLGTATLLGALSAGLVLAYREDRRSRERISHTSEALRESEAILRSVGDNLPDSYIYQYTLLPDGSARFLYVSAGVERIHGCKPAAVLDDAMVLLGQIDPAMRVEHGKAEARSLQEMSDFDMELLVRPPGVVPRWLHVRSRPRRRLKGQVVWEGVAIDITERKHDSEALLSHQLMLEQTGHIAKVGGWTLDIATGQGAWTKELALIHDLDPETPIDLERGLSFYTEGSRPRIEEAVQRAVTQGESYDMELELISAKGVYKWVRTIGHAVRENGRIVRLHGSLQDISERKRLEQQFLRAQRLEAVGTLAGGLSHDLNNILAPIMMIAGMLKDRLRAPEDLHALDMLETAAKRGAAIIRQLLTFSRGGERGDRVSVQLRYLLKELGTLMRETFPREISIREYIGADLWPVHGDPTQLHQVLLNLCVNARDAMPEGGALMLTVRNTELDAADARQHPRALAGRYVAIAITDTGHGISPEHLNCIFDPFFTTKEPGKGTGLGLSTVLGIIESHGGFVTVQSEVGRGTTFNVMLPALVQDAVQPVTQGSGVAEQADGGECVLVVDDEAGIREVTRQVLEAHRYRVVEAANGEEALAAFAAHRDSIALVVTDMMMPVMGGLELAQRLRQAGARVPIIATTGLGMEAHKQGMAELGVDTLLLKPYLSADLLRSVRTALGH